MFGLNADPTTNASYTSIDFAWYFVNGQAQVWESGSNKYSAGAFTVDTVLSIEYDGAELRYLKDGVVQRTVSTSGIKYFDSSFYALSSSVGIKNVRFGPMGPKGSQGVTGSAVWYSYHDNLPTSTPSTPTGDGTTSGWHAALTDASVWVSTKQTVNRGDAGSWSVPAILPYIKMAPTFDPQYRGVGTLASINTAEFAGVVVYPDGTTQSSGTITPNVGDWMYNNADAPSREVYRWTGSTWTTSGVTSYHRASTTEDLLRLLKGGASAPSGVTFIESLLGSTAFFQSMATRVLYSSNWGTGDGIKIDLNANTIECENGAWSIVGGLATFRDVRIYGIDFEELDCGTYAAEAPEWPYDDGGELDCGEADGTFIPDRLIECGYVLGDD
jgi:hypothetical protein